MSLFLSGLFQFILELKKVKACKMLEFWNVGVWKYGEQVCGLESGPRMLFSTSQASPRGRLLGTCKADAISASARLASAPTGQLLPHKHPIYITNFQASYQQYQQSW